MEIKRIFDLLPHYAESFKPKEDVLACKEKGKWKTYSIEQYRDYVTQLSYGFLALGVKEGDKIATITNNRPEWNFIDMAVMQVGAIHTPIYPTISESDYKYILNHAEVQYAFVAGEELFRKIEHIIPEVPSLKDVYTFRNLHGVKHLNELYELGRSNPNQKEIKQRMDKIKTDDVATIIYTSGTTGNPKGVMLTHRNLISNFVGVSIIPTFGEEGKALSFLPLCHVYERMLNYLYQYLGISIYYVESMATISANVNEIQPDMMSAVPRFLEKVYDKIINKGRQLKGIKKQIFFWAVNIARKYDPSGENSWFFYQQHKIAYKLVLSKWRQAMGNNFKIIVSGGAAIQPDLARSLWAANLPVYEGYGLTETSPVIAVTNTHEKNGLKIGTVGLPLPGMDVKIDDDGEIICKGPSVMKGYYREPERTKEVIDENGWFHTGDMGRFLEGGQLQITGRKKEIFKTSLGKYISPERVENKIKQSQFIDHIMVVGENQKFAAALVVPDFDHLRSYCEIKNIEYTTDEEMVNMPRLRQRIKQEVDKYNKELGSTEQVKKIDILPIPWTVKGGELTPTLKLKRDVITKRYKDRIDKLYRNNN
ncbi:MAG: long-chain fatty acid--CoA ligase [Bacteroidales bacterium]|nr:long-chain fatty acid--CoA ligase [Bacteroidales bacterium]